MWLALAAGVITIGLLVYRFTLPGQASLGLPIGGITAGLVIACIIVATFLGSIRARAARLAKAFPDALRLSILVTDGLASGSDELETRRGWANVRMNRNTYAAIAIDAEGIHVATAGGKPFGLIPAEFVTVDGFGSAAAGLRVMRTIDLRVTSADSTVRLPIVPLRTPGNLLRVFTREEFITLKRAVESALGGA